MSAGHTEMKPCPKTIWLQPDCMTTPDYGRVWCEHDAPVNCDCPDGPHPWIKFDRAIEAAEADLLGRALAALRMAAPLLAEAREALCGRDDVCTTSDGDDALLPLRDAINFILSQAREVK